MKLHKTDRKTKAIKTNTRLSVLLVPLVLACFGPMPVAEAVVPAPDGGYAGFNTAKGQNALKNLTSGVGNAAVGWYSLFTNTDGSFNTALGAGTLLFNLGDQSTGQGIENTAVGAAALLFNTTGSNNTAVGTQALFSNTEGILNTATGYQALANNTTGRANTASGNVALFNNTTGGANTASGFASLYNNTLGNGNNAFGVNALASNTTGNYNTAIGHEALISNNTGVSNTATGHEALFSNTAGVENTAVGSRSLVASTGSYNVALSGGSNLTTGDFNIYIGNDGAVEESGTIRIGSFCCQSRAFMSGISGATVSGGATVYVKSDGQLGTSTSSARFKQDIRDMGAASETLLALRPVTFHYKPEFDPESLAQFGLIAEEVEKANPALVVRDKEGKAYSVRYEQVNAMLLNEFLKEHKKVQKLEATLEAVNARLEEQAAQIQKVTAQVDATKPLPHLVLNNL